MSKLILAAFLFCAVNAQALSLPSAGFSDTEIREKVQATVTAMNQTNDLGQRFERLVELQTAVETKLRTMPLPDFETVDSNDPGMRNYTSLNEFTTDLDVLANTVRSTGSCQNVHAEILKVTNTDDNASAERAPETYITRQIAKALCQ
jgi:hypothetical protein